MKLIISGLLVGGLVFPILANADAAKGKTVFDQRCVTCHGPAGAGDGPIALSLPEDQRPKGMKTGVFKYASDDAKMKEVISKGGAALGLNPLMPPHPDLSNDDLTNLVEYVRSLKQD